MFALNRLLSLHFSVPSEVVDWANHFWKLALGQFMFVLIFSFPPIFSELTVVSFFLIKQVEVSACVCFYSEMKLAMFAES